MPLKTVPLSNTIFQWLFQDLSGSGFKGIKGSYLKEKW